MPTIRDAMITSTFQGRGSEYHLNKKVDKAALNIPRMVSMISIFFLFSYIRIEFVFLLVFFFYD